MHFPNSYRRSGKVGRKCGKLLTFGRWAWCDVWENAAAGSFRGGGAFAHLLKVGRKCVETAHLRKVVELAGYAGSAMECDRK